MKQNFKRFLSWTLALLMTLSLLPAGLLTAPAYAEELVDELVNDAQAEEFTVQAARVKVVFVEAEHGKYIVNDSERTFPQTFDQAPTNFHLRAYPDEGYRFSGWYDDQGNRINDEKDTYIKFTNDCTITARFETMDTATFKVGNKTFTGLQAAIDDAQGSSDKTITLTNNGSIYGNYTIPEGITLLIPFDAAGTVDANTPGYIQEGSGNYEVPSVFRKLTMENGASIVVEGAISVGGKHYTCSSAKCCMTTGPYGQIQMEAGSSITLKNGAKLYAWGYITGDGQITANSGAEVYEYFQIMDWRGGSCTSDMEGNKEKVFPFSQYYVQNIEAALTIQNGATEYAYLSVTATLIRKKITKSVKISYVGENGLFSLGEGASLTKKYDPKNDRIIFKIMGDAELSEIQLKMRIGIIYNFNFKSSDYVLPINNNVDMQILSGTTTVSKDAALLPGVAVSIAKGAELKVAEGANLYVYAAEQWSKAYVQRSNDLGISPVEYSPSRQGSRTISDATIDVNGTLTAAGAIYTTKGGANICSSKGAGVYVQQGQLGKSSETYQCIQDDRTPKYTAIPITPAKLRNGDGSYTPTEGSEAGTTINYVNGVWGGTEACMHTETEVRDAKPATCAQEGYTGDTYCKSCEEKIATGTTIPKTQNHTWNNGTVTTAATCTVAGVRTFTCSVCQETKMEEIPASGHTGGRATCKEKAKCETCGEEYGALDPANHAGTETDWIKTENTHKETYRCCGAVKTEEAAHTFGEWSDGKHTCSICGYEAKCGHNDENKDHKCDICGKTLTECADANKDHKCDICGETLSECLDTNKDHKCDICGETLSQCADANKDHKCDICGKTLSECLDTNSDHKCDTCGETLSQCADTNKDHKCDICGETLSQCADTNKDHKCDICGKTLSQCADANKDHKCDTCGKTLSQCADTNKDHKCDTCGKTLSQCADTNNDHKCDICGETLTECADANKDHKCDTCGKTLSECLDENKDHKCDICSKTLTECADANKDHKCDICGKELSVHTFGKWCVTKAADYVTPGEKTHTCSVCNAAETEAIPSILQQLKDLEITATKDGYTMTLPTGKKVLVLLAGYSGVGQLKSIQVLSVGETGEVSFALPSGASVVIFFLQEDYKPLCSREVTQ